jgi:hypothetical protein
VTPPEPTSDMKCRNTKLFCCGKSKGNVVAASVQPIVFRRARCHQYLKGRRPVQVSIACRVRRKKIMPPKVHHDKAVAADKSAPVSPRSQLVPIDIECRFGDEVRLILFLYLAGVTRSINQRHEHHALVFKANASRISALDRRTLAPEEHRCRHNFRGLSCIKYGGLHGIRSRYRGLPRGRLCNQNG